MSKARRILRIRARLERLASVADQLRRTRTPHPPGLIPRSLAARRSKETKRSTP